MSLTWQQKQSRLDWARRNPDKIREANRKWRAGREHILRAQARERMRRLRARRAPISKVSGPAAK